MMLIIFGFPVLFRMFQRNKSGKLLIGVMLRNDVFLKGTSKNLFLHRLKSILVDCGQPKNEFLEVV
jgi:hypothetical protein